MTKFALEKSTVTFVFCCLLMVYGFLSFLDLPRAKDPGFKIRTATVVTVFPGANAGRVEELVTDKLEKAIQEIPEIDNIKSTSKNGVSVIFVNISEAYKNMRPIWDSLRRKVEKGAADLPAEALAPVVNDEFGDVFGTMIAVTGEGLSYAELEDIADDAKDVYLRLSEVAKVDILGAQPQRVYIEFDNSKLAKLNLSASYLREYLNKKNIVLSGGSIKIDASRLVVEPSGNYENIEQIRNTVVPLSTGEQIYLKDIADVEYGYEDPSSFITHKNAGYGIVLAISTKENGDIVKLGEEIEKQTALIQEKAPLGVKLEKIFDEPRIVNSIIDNFVSNLIQAVVLVILVMLFSLGLRVGLIVATLIPLAIFSAFIVMSFFDIWLDQVSLAALIIALGLIADCAIVMSESIMVLMQKGKGVYEAALQSAKELKVPLFTSALTTAMAFLPIFLAKSAVGEYTNSIFKVVTITLMSSWLIALTITPVLCKYFMKIGIKVDDKKGRIYTIYEKFLNFILSYRWATITVVALIFFSSLRLFDYIPRKFFPPATEATFTLEMRLPTGSAIEMTQESVLKIENYIKSKYMDQSEAKENKVVNTVAFIGESAPRFWLSYDRELASVEYATLLVNLNNFNDLETIKKDVENFARVNFPDMQVVAKSL